MDHVKTSASIVPQVCGRSEQSEHKSNADQAQCVPQYVWEHIERRGA